MDAATEALLKTLLEAQPVGALGTLRRGRAGAGDDPEPVVSMVPVAWLPGSTDAVIHVSALSPHTRDLLERPRVSLMLAAPLGSVDNPQALPRATLQADAALIERDTPAYAQARDAYLARFAQATQTFALGDFSLFRITPRSVRFIAGFGRAHAVSAQAFERIVRSLGPAR